MILVCGYNVWVHYIFINVGFALQTDFVCQIFDRIEGTIFTSILFFKIIYTHPFEGHPTSIHSFHYWFWSDFMQN